MEGNNSLFISGECVEEPGMDHLHGACHRRSSSPKMAETRTTEHYIRNINMQ